MGRKLAFNEDMAELREMIGRYMGNQRTIRARYAAMAEKEIADQRAEIQRRMVVDFPDAGPSEFANSTGLSRSTVIRWLEEAGERHLTLAEPATVNEAVVFGSQEADGRKVAYIYREGQRLFLLTGDTFGYGDFIEDADKPGNLTTAPEWLTEDLMRQAIEETGASLPYAPWDVRARYEAKKEKS